MDKYDIDNQKLKYHPIEVARWLKDELTYPIYAEISPTDICNHNCIFCSFNYLQNRTNILSKDVMISLIDDFADMGVKAFMWGGEGEPLLNKYVPLITDYAKYKGIDIALTTNGVHIEDYMMDQLLRNLSWIKVSIDAGIKEDYYKIHRCNPDDFERVISNIKKMVEYRDSKNLDCTIGGQVLLLPENIDNIENLFKTFEDINIDYITIKPFTASKYRLGFNSVDYTDMIDYIKELSSKYRNIILRENTFSRLDDARSYNKCFALDFMSYIAATGDVYLCHNYLGDKEYIYGNIYKKSFRDIWITRPNKNIDVSNCKKICRMDKVNLYLWNLKYGVKHRNFI